MGGKFDLGSFLRSVPASFMKPAAGMEEAAARWVVLLVVAVLFAVAVVSAVARFDKCCGRYGCACDVRLCLLCVCVLGCFVGCDIRSRFMCVFLCLVAYAVFVVVLFAALFRPICGRHIQISYSIPARLVRLLPSVMNPPPPSSRKTTAVL